MISVLPLPVAIQNASLLRSGRGDALDGIRHRHEAHLLAHVAVDVAGERLRGRGPPVEEEFRVERGQLLEVAQGDRLPPSRVHGRQVAPHVVVVAGQVAGRNGALLPAPEHPPHMAAAVRVVPLLGVLQRVEQRPVGPEAELQVGPAEEHEPGFEPFEGPRGRDAGDM